MEKFNLPVKIIDAKAHRLAQADANPAPFLDEAISKFLQRPDCYALPNQQRHLITLLVRKVLASSSQAVAGTLEMMRDRLIRLRDELKSKAGGEDGQAG